MRCNTTTCCPETPGPGAAGTSRQDPARRPPFDTSHPAEGSSRADLVVVGARGHGEMSWLLGSVSPLTLPGGASPASTAHEQGQRDSNWSNS